MGSGFGLMFTEYICSGAETERVRQHCVAFVLLCRIVEAIFAELGYGADGRRQRMNAVQDMIVRYLSMFRDLYGRDTMIQKARRPTPTALLIDLRTIPMRY